MDWGTHGITDKELKQHIMSECRGISFAEVMEMRDAVIYNGKDLDELIKLWNEDAIKQHEIKDL